MNNRRTGWMPAALVLAAMIAAPLATAQQRGDAEVLLQAAVHTELVEGDLERAIELYKEIVASNGGNHAVAARALVYMGRSYEKLGSAEARKAYERVLSDYADQQEQVAAARTRLAALTQGARAATESGMAIRRVWTYSESLFDVAGTVSADGRYLTFEDMTTGDLMVRDLVTGENRRLTHNRVPSRLLKKSSVFVIA